jgi:hypothetical protein
MQNSWFYCNKLETIGTDHRIPTLKDIFRLPSTLLSHPIEYGIKLDTQIIKTNFTFSTRDLCVNAASC